MIGSLFSGIGGLELGLERAGLGPVAWQVEIDPFRRAVLAKHWPDIARHEDVRSARNLPYVETICGGFPCQDLSDASHGAGAGLAGPRSGLWREFARIIGEVRPRIVVVENVSGAAARRWVPTVRRDLHLLGYRTRALGVNGRDVGAPHARARVFVVGHADQEGQPARPQHAEVAGVRTPTDSLRDRWRTAPARRRVADGVPGRLDGCRTRAIGDAVMPDCAEIVGRLIALTYCNPAQEKK